MDFSQDLVRGSVVPIVLALLKDRPMYGYEIVKVVNARTNGRFEWREGTLYPALHKLEADRMLTSKWQDVPGEKGEARSRKYYYITRKGLTELTRRTAEWKEFSWAVNACVLGA
jgi:PadR family transcriptional regulator, regulatory protein PadR